MLRSPRLLVALSCILGTMGAARSAWAIEQTASVADDTFVQQFGIYNNNVAGASVSLFTGARYNDGTATSHNAVRSLIKFNLPSATYGLAGRVNVTGAYVNFYTKAVGRTTGAYVGGAGVGAWLTFWRVYSGWYGGGGTGSSGIACDGGASWIRPSCGVDVGWSWAGGGTASYYSPHANDTNVNQYATYNNLAADVQAWIDGASNQGWLITSETEGSGGSSMQRFHSANDTGFTPWLHVYYDCKSGFQQAGTACTTCTNGNNSRCGVVESGYSNTCNDPGGNTTEFSCTCNHAAYVTSGSKDCANRDECAQNSNPCNDDGDTNGVCNDAAAPSTGWSCSCTTASGFVPSGDGKKCVTACGGAIDPCGNGGTCALVGTGAWTCACPSGWTSTGGTHPQCLDTDACENTAACTTLPGNACVDDAAPALTYHCTCANPGTELGTVDGKSACLDKNDCVTDHVCGDGGNLLAQCADRFAPAVGYTCKCSSALWTVSDLGTTATCVDVDECAGATNPCGKGACTNIPTGGGYTCACNAGYVIAGSDPRRPTCVDPRECASDPCSAAGDNGSSCVEHLPPTLGYECECSDGFSFDGATCQDVNECNGPNPCGRGTCQNTKGGYQCECGAGLTLVGGAHPTCAKDGVYPVQVTVEPGVCAVQQNSADPSALVVLLALWLVSFRRRASSRGARTRATGPSTRETG